MKRFLLLALCAHLAALPSSADVYFYTCQESGGTFVAGQKIRAGMTRHDNVVPGSLSIVAGDYVWNDNGNGRLVFTDPNGGAASQGGGGSTGETAMTAALSGSGTILYSSGAWTIQVNPAVSSSRAIVVRYSYYADGSGGAANPSVVTVEEPVAPFLRGNRVFPGRTGHENVVPGSLQISVEGGYVWNDDGSGRLVFTDPCGAQSQTDQTSYSVVPKQESVGTVSERSQEYPLSGSDVVPGSVVVQTGAYTFQDNGFGVLVLTGGNAASGTVAYDSGSITLTFSGSYPNGKEVTASYKYMVSDNTQVVCVSLSGSGTIQYSSGAWTAQMYPELWADARAVVRYSYWNDAAWFAVREEIGGVFSRGRHVVSGKTTYANVVQGSVQVSAGGFVWNDDGNGRLVFTDPHGATGGPESSTHPEVVKAERVGTLSSSARQSFNLTGADIVHKSVVVTAGTITFQDDGNGVLVASTSAASGTVTYASGAITLEFKSVPQSGAAVTATYKYMVANGSQIVSESISGSGAILYASGAWTLQVNPAMAAYAPVRIVYGYYVNPSADGTDDGAIPSRTASGDQVKAGKRTWSFDANPDGKTCTVVGVFPANGALKIPAKLGGLAVTGIDGDFFRNPTMTALSIPAGVREIGGGPGACAALKSLKVAAKNKTFKSSDGVLWDKRKKKIFGVVPTKSKYAVPASVTWIAEDAFGPKTAVSVAKKNKKFTVSGGILYDRKKKTVLHCPKAKRGTVRLPSSVTAIGAGAFRDCTGAKKIVLGKKVARIGEDAFRGCSGLRSLTLPASVETIEGNPFACSGLKTVKVASGNGWYAAAGGLLLSKDKRTLVAAPPAAKGSPKIPASVVRIGRGAFDGRAAASFSVASGNPAFKASGGVLYSKDGKTLVAYPAGRKKASFKIPAAVETVRGHAFADCPKLGSVVVPAGVKRIERAAFGSENRKPGLRKLSLPNRAACDVARQRLPAACKVAYRNKAPAYRIRLSANGGAAKDATAISGIGADESPFVDLVAFRDRAAALPASPFEKRGRIFAGWAATPGGAAKYADRASVKNLAASGRTAVLYAAWRSARTTWRFDANGGTGTMAPVVDDYDKWTATAPACGFRRAGATFDRWNTEPDGSGRDYRPGDPLHGSAFESDATATLYAIWGVPATVSFDANGGEGTMADLTVDWGDSAELPGCTYTNAGSTFAWWSTQPDDSGCRYDPGDSVCNDGEGDVPSVLYAVWKPDLTVTFDANGGEGEMDDLIVRWNADWGDYRDSIPECAFTNSGWTFDHWNTQPDDWGDSYWSYSEFSLSGDSESPLVLYAIWTYDDYDPAPGADASAGAAGNGVSFSASGDMPWTDATFAGVPCFESGAAGDGGKSTLLASAEGSGTLAFRWRTSSEEGRDIVFFSVDGKDVSSRSGLDDDWTAVSLRIEGDGPHALSWTYAKDASGSAGDDRARLADVNWFAD